MKCYDCNIEVVKDHYPDGRCPSCDRSYVLPDSEWTECTECGSVPANPKTERCLDCLLN